MKSKKGFTLLEISLVLAVTAVAMALLSVVMVQINAFVVNKNLQTDRLTETQTFEKTFALALEVFQNPNFALLPAEDANQVVFAGQGASSAIFFQENTLWQDEISLAQFKQIQKVAFSAQDNLIKCQLVFDANTTHTLIFTKRI